MDVVPPDEVRAKVLAAAMPERKDAVPLGLPRLKSTAEGNDAPLDGRRFEVDPLDVPGNANKLSKKRRAGLPYIAVEPGGEWTRKLRGSRREVVFVSFLLASGVSAAVDVGGARLRLAESTRSGFAELEVGETDEANELRWRPLRYRVPLDRFDGQQLAVWPLLTLRIDPAAGVWDVFSGIRLVAHDLPLVAAPANAREFAVNAGSAEAWVCGLVVSDENPLFVDANTNSIPDAFEVEKRGSLLPANTIAADRKALAHEWRLAPQPQPQPLRFSRPISDRHLAAGAVPAN